jgi:hypothetical protein
MVYQLDESINAAVEQFVEENCKEGDREQTGLDPRAFSGKFWYCYEGIFIYAGSRGRLDYYGGFEYIDSECVKSYGDYVFYSADANRVQEVLENLMEREDA